MMSTGGFWGAMGVWGWLVMIGFWVTLIAAVLWTVTRLFPAGEYRGDAKEVLDRRFAAGEIDAQTHKEIREQLAGSSRP